MLQKFLLLLCFGAGLLGGNPIDLLASPTAQAPSGPAATPPKNGLKEKEVMINGWYPWDPFQYEQRGEGTTAQLAGLDVELTRAITQAAGKKVVYEPISWKQHQLDLKEGKRDFASGATYTKDRAEYVYFSDPYRVEENALFVRRGKEGIVRSDNVSVFLEDVSAKKIRLGLIDGYVYADPKINEWAKNPANRKQIVFVPDDTQNIDNLLMGKIDAFLADRIVGATLIWRGKHGSEINEVRLNVKTPIHFMFSKKAVPYAVVKKFNQAIHDVQTSDRYRQIISWYLYPLLLLQTIDARWFKLIDLIGTIAFAISGLVIAYRVRTTIFGAFIFAFLPALGGGLMRDVIQGRYPVAAMGTPIYMIIVASVVLIGFVALRVIERIKKRDTKKQRQLVVDQRLADNILSVCDGLGLAAFTVTGVVVSVMMKAEPLWLWGSFFAFLTGAGGGILRDILSKSNDIVSFRGDIYPEVPVFWGLLLSIYLTYEAQTPNPDLIQAAVFMTVIGAFLTRLAVYYRRVPNIFFRP